MFSQQPDLAEQRRNEIDEHEPEIIILESEEDHN